MRHPARATNRVRAARRADAFQGRAPAARRVRPGLLLALVLLGTACGCRGRAEYFRGEDLRRLGRDREAYYQFWKAYRTNPSDKYRAALQGAARSVAEVESRRARELELQKDFSGALAHYELALEYMPRSSYLGGEYSRLQRWRSEWCSLERDLEAHRQDPGRQDQEAWGELDLLLAMAEHPARDASWSADFARAGDRVVGATLQALRQETFQPSLAEDAAILRAHLMRWRRLGARCRFYLYRESARGFRAGAPGSLSPRSLLSVLTSALGEVRSGEKRLERALEGAVLHDEAASLERQGDLDGASQLFARASLLHPGHERSREGLERVRRQVALEFYEEAVGAIHAGDWGNALEVLTRLRAVRPDYRDSEALAAVAREKLGRVHALQARRYHDAGLMGNALVHFCLARQFLPGDETYQKWVEQLEDGFEARLRPDFEVTLSADVKEPGPVGAVPLAKPVVAALGKLLSADPERADIGGKKAVGSGQILELEVAALEFDWPQASRTTGFERAVFPGSFKMVDNPSVERARQELRRAREVLSNRLRAHRDRSNSFQDELVTLAQRKLSATETKLGAFPERVATLLWEDTYYPVQQVQGEARLVARYRLGGEEREIAVTESFRDRVVVGNPDRNVPADPTELPGREQVLGLLGARLAPTLARDVVVALEARRERLYDEAIRYFESSSFDLATESVVAFLYSRRDPSGERFESAVDLLKKLTGCDLRSRLAR